MSLHRRSFLTNTLAASTTAALFSTGTTQAADEIASPKATPAQRFGVSTYSFFKFGSTDNLPVDKCIELAADMGFDGVELLHVQMEGDSQAYLNSLKRKAFTLGLDLMGLSTHQTFVSPDEAVRKKNIEHTTKCPEIACQLGIADRACSGQDLFRGRHMVHARHLLL